MAITSSLCGCGGSVTGVGGATEVKNWTIDLTMDSTDATSFDSKGWHEKVACVKGGSGSFQSVGNASPVGDQASASFLTQAAGGITISGAIIITKFALDVKVTDVVRYNMDFVFTGPITCATFEPADEPSSGDE